MAKASKTAEESSPDTSDGGSVMGYFREIYRANPKLLKVRSNEEVYRRWLADHPDYSEVPEKIKNGLANLKSLMRKNKPKRTYNKSKGEAKFPAAATPSNGTPTLHVSVSKLEGLEQQIDDCIVLAKNLDREGLENVIRSLRRARNEIVIRLGDS